MLGESGVKLVEKGKWGSRAKIMADNGVWWLALVV
jgi:hypothetical protein